MRNGVEKGPDIKVEYPVLGPAPAAAYGQRVMGAAPGTVAVAVAVEDRLQFFLQQHRCCSLRHPVGRGGDGDFILPSCSHVLDWIWILAIGAGHGAVVMLS